MRKQIHRYLMVTGTAVLIACNPAPPCPSCAEDEPIGDLPCDGGDLPKDGNCEECEQQCLVWYEGSPYEVGGCVDGKCGPVWYVQEFDPVSLDGPPPPAASCDEVCASHSTTCVARACSGKTGYMCSTTFGVGCSLTEPYQYPVDWFGDCDEAVPWFEFDGGAIPQLGCCCWFAS